ncbi:MAG: amidase family protein, partial [Thermohalobaculum sp.]|nr:amidase family protein [Thermohalobaculum sp.]
MDEIIRMTAREVVDRLATGALSHAEVLDALEARVRAVDGAVNALPTLCFDRARDRAAAVARRPAAERGPLGGLPVPIKDLADVAGVRSTQGSPIYADHVPAASDHIVERIEASGGVVYAKSNTPEFGAGGSTFNEVFGRTCNPWNLSRSAAGSSGGAAAALAAGMAWVAQGSDMGGSLRNPASFCGVAGLRPSPGRAPRG